MSHTVIAYIRVSTSKQETDRQRTAAAEHIARAGMVSLGTVEEPERKQTRAVSGRARAVKLSPRRALAYYAALAGGDLSKLERQGFRELLQRVRVERPTYVLAYSLDRLSRDATELDLLRRILEDAGTAMLILNANGVLDTTTASGKFMFRLLAAQAECECDVIAERTRHKLATAPRPRAARGNPGLGWRVVKGAVLPDEPARERLRLALQLEADGFPRAVIAARLGISPRWIANTLRAAHALADAGWPTDYWTAPASDLDPADLFPLESGSPNSNSGNHSTQLDEPPTA